MTSQAMFPRYFLTESSKSEQHRETGFLMKFLGRLSLWKVQNILVRIGLTRIISHGVHDFYSTVHVCIIVNSIFGLSESRFTEYWRRKTAIIFVFGIVSFGAFAFLVTVITVPKNKFLKIRYFIENPKRYQLTNCGQIYINQLVRFAITVISFLFQSFVFSAHCFIFTPHSVFDIVSLRMPSLNLDGIAITVSSLSLLIINFVYKVAQNNYIYYP